MRTKTLLCRLRKLHTSRLLHGAPQPGPSDLMAARPGSNMLTSQRGISRGADAGARSALFGEYHVRANATGSRDNHISTSLGSVRFMGVGSLKEGNRAGQHGAKYPQGKPDGSPEKAESDARRQFLEKAKAESASSSEAQETTGGSATTELQFGVKDGKNTDEAISNASEELFKQSTITAKSSEGPIKEEDKRKYPEHQKASEVSIAAEKDETHSGSDQRDFQGQEHDDKTSVLGAGESHADEASASGETARENIDKTRSEMRSGTGRRSPQAGVIVGNVASAGANALETEDDTPAFPTDPDETGDETLDKAQKSFEQAISGFGTTGDQNLQHDPNATSDPKFHKSSNS